MVDKSYVPYSRQKNSVTCLQWSSTSETIVFDFTLVWFRPEIVSPSELSSTQRTPHLWDLFNFYSLAGSRLSSWSFIRVFFRHKLVSRFRTFCVSKDPSLSEIRPLLFFGMCHFHMFFSSSTYSAIQNFCGAHGKLNFGGLSLSLYSLL